MKQLYDRILNFIWFLLHQKEWRKFKKKIKKKGYNLKDVYFNRRIGFICLPPERLN